jgi:CRISPR system Cascade subunit CasD
MTRFLILKLDGVMQAWGDHSFEDYRPTVGFPTRSGLLGLLAACLGIDRTDAAALTALDKSLWLTVRAEDRARNAPLLRIADFHTVLNARKVDIRKSSEYPVVSRREYLCDAVFSVAIEQASAAEYPLERIAAALQRPVFTPSLGRRSCPLSRPLLATYVEAENPAEALHSWAPNAGTVFSDSPALESDRELRVRDVPRYGRIRQFGTRRVFIIAQGANHVSE